jgi:hypothetical protein
VIIRYDVTVADMTDVMRRAASRREPRLGWRWKQNVLISALLTAFFAGAIDASDAARMFAAAGFFVVAYMVFTYFEKRRVASGLERYVVEQFGQSAPFPFEIELTGAGMTTRQLGEEIRREWNNVEKITEAIGGIEFDIRRGGMVFVRDTGFKSPDERTEFLRLARQYVGH